MSIDWAMISSEVSLSAYINDNRIKYGLYLDDS